MSNIIMQLCNFKYYFLWLYTELPTILLQNQVPKGMKKSEALTQMEAAIKKYTSEIHLTEDDLYEPEKKQPPRYFLNLVVYYYFFIK